MTKVFIIHGWEGHPEEGWLPWLGRKLTKIGCEVEIPQMPNRVFPVFTDWIKAISKLVGKAPEKTILIGHSLGCTVVLNYLHQGSGSTKFKAIILVSPFVRDIGADTVHDFVNRDLDWNKIKSRAVHFTVAHSQDDLVVPFSEGKYIAKKLSAEFVLANHFHHFSEVDNIKTVPFIYDICEKVIFET